MDKIAEMLLFVSLYLGDYPVNDLPALRFVSIEDIRKLCDGHHCSAYYSRQVIYLTEDYNNEILFHEVVHHHQEMTGRWGTVPSRERWEARENEAHVVQKIWNNYK